VAFLCHEYTPFCDPSDLGPPDWAVLANDIKANYLQFDGFVVVVGTDTMATALLPCLSCWRTSESQSSSLAARYLSVSPTMMHDATSSWLSYLL